MPPLLTLLLLQRRILTGCHLLLLSRPKQRGLVYSGKLFCAFMVRAKYLYLETHRLQPAPQPIKEEAALVSAPIEEATKEPESQELEEARPVVEEGVSAVKEQSKPAEPIIAQDNEPAISDVNKASENTEVAEPVLEDLPSVVKPKTPIGRRLKQDVPVILPGGGTNLGSVGVRFGNLNLADDELALEEEEATKDELAK